MDKLNPFGRTQVFLQIFLSILCLAVCSGCMTKTVRNTGLRTETLEFHKVLIAILFLTILVHLIINWYSLIRRFLIIEHLDVGGDILLKY